MISQNKKFFNAITNIDFYPLSANQDCKIIRSHIFFQVPFLSYQWFETAIYFQNGLWDSTKSFALKWPKHFCIYIYWLKYQQSIVRMLITIINQHFDTAYNFLRIWYKNTNQPWLSVSMKIIKKSAIFLLEISKDWMWRTLNEPSMQSISSCETNENSQKGLRYLHQRSTFFRIDYRHDWVPVLMDLRTNLHSVWRFSWYQWLSARLWYLQFISNGPWR